jgi:hypothetical protein
MKGREAKGRLAYLADASRWRSARRNLAKGRRLGDEEARGRGGLRVRGRCGGGPRASAAEEARAAATGRPRAPATLQGDRFHH